MEAKYRNVVLYRLINLSSLKFVGNIFVSSLFDLPSVYIISSHVIAESSVIRCK